MSATAAEDHLSFQTAENVTINDAEVGSKQINERLSLRERIFLTFSEPTSSPTAYCVSFYFDALVALSMVLMCAETVVAWSRTRQQQRTWQLLETILTMNFLVDFVVKLVTARPLLKYILKRPSFTIDLLGLIPFFAERLVERFSADEGSSIKALRVLRLLRFFRLSRIAYENFPDFRMFIQAVRRSKLAIAFLGMYVFGAGLLFASCIYFAETSECYLDPKEGVWYYLTVRSGDGSPLACSVQNMFGAWWFTLVTMTTVGYGDVNVISPWGRILTVLIMITSLVFLALPSAIFAANLTEMYLERRLARKHGNAGGNAGSHNAHTNPHNTNNHEIEGLMAGFEVAEGQVQAALATLTTHLNAIQSQQAQLHALLTHHKKTKEGYNTNLYNGNSSNKMD